MTRYKNTLENVQSCANRGAFLLWRRSMNMLPVPRIEFAHVVNHLVTPDYIDASRQVAVHCPPADDQRLNIDIEYGYVTMRCVFPQPKKSQIWVPHLPPDNGDPHAIFNLLLDDEPPPAWLEPLATWVQASTDIFGDCQHYVNTVRALCERVGLERMRMLWPDWPLLFDVTVKDEYHHSNWMLTKQRYEAAAHPRGFRGLFPGLGKDIERAQQTVGRALLAAAEPLKSEGAGVLPGLQRRVSTEIMNKVINVWERAGMQDATSVYLPCS